jgi:hypothetical protein
LLAYERDGAYAVRQEDQRRENYRQPDDADGPHQQHYTLRYPENNVQGAAWKKGDGSAGQRWAWENGPETNISIP